MNAAKDVFTQRTETINNHSSGEEASRHPKVQNRRNIQNEKHFRLLQNQRHFCFCFELLPLSWPLVSCTGENKLSFYQLQCLIDGVTSRSRGGVEGGGVIVPRTIIGCELCSVCGPDPPLQSRLFTS